MDRAHVLGGDGGCVGSFFLEGGEYFDAFDGIDTEVGIEVHVEFEHFSGVAGFFGDRFEKGGGHVAAGTVSGGSGNGRRLGGGSGRGCGLGRGSGGCPTTGPCEEVDDVAEGVDRAHVLGGDGGCVGSFFLEGGEHFDAFDGIDTEVGMEVHVEFEHFGGVACFFGDRFEKGGGHVAVGIGSGGRGDGRRFGGGRGGGNGRRSRGVRRGDRGKVVGQGSRGGGCRRQRGGGKTEDHLLLLQEVVNGLLGHRLAVEVAAVEKGGLFLDLLQGQDALLYGLEMLRQRFRGRGEGRATLAGGGRRARLRRPRRFRRAGHDVVGAGEGDREFRLLLRRRRGIGIPGGEVHLLSRYGEPGEGAGEVENA